MINFLYSSFLPRARHARIPQPPGAVPRAAAAQAQREQTQQRQEEQTLPQTDPPARRPHSRPRAPHTQLRLRNRNATELLNQRTRRTRIRPPQPLRKPRFVRQQRFTQPPRGRHA